MGLLEYSLRGKGQLGEDGGHFQNDDKKREVLSAMKTLKSLERNLNSVYSELIAFKRQAKELDEFLGYR